MYTLFLKPLSQEQDCLSKNVQSLVRPSNGESSADNGSKLDGLVL